MQRIARIRTPGALQWLHPGGVRRAVVIAVFLDGPRIQLELARCRPQRIEQRIGPKIGMPHEVLGLGRDRKCQRPIALPEHVEHRHLHALGARLDLGCLVQIADPLHLGEPRRELLALAKMFRDGREDVEITACLEHRLDDLLHRHDVALRIIAHLLDIVALIGRGGRQHDVGMARRGRPLHVVHDERIQIAPGTPHLVAVLLVGKRVSARPVGQLDQRQLDLVSVELHHLAGIQQRLHQPRHRNRDRPALRQPGRPLVGLPRRIVDGLQDRRGGRGRTARRIVIAQAVAPSRQTDLPQHRCQRDQHPVYLLAMMLTLRRIAQRQHRAVGREAARQIAQRLRRHAAYSCRPFRRLGRTVALAQQVRQEPVEAGGIAIKECLIVQLLRVQRMSNAQHHRHVGLRARRNPLAVQLLAGLREDRVDADHLRARLLHGGHPRPGTMVSHLPGNLRIVQRVAAPEHHQLAMLGQVLPRGALLIHFQRTRHIGQDHLRCTGGIVTAAVGIAARQVQHTPQQRLAVVDAPRALPAIRPCKHGLLPVLLAHPNQLVGHQLDGLVPAHPHKITAAPAIRISARPLLQPGTAHHRIADARWRIERIQHARQLWRRCRITRPGLELHRPAIFHDAIERTPVAA